MLHRVLGVGALYFIISAVGGIILAAGVCIAMYLYIYSAPSTIGQAKIRRPFITVSTCGILR